MPHCKKPFITSKPQKSAIHKISYLAGFIVMLGLFSPRNLFAQETKNGIYAGYWGKKNISVYAYHDSIKIKYWTKNNEQITQALLCKNTCSILIGNIQYDLTFLPDKQPMTISLKSAYDTLEIIKLTSISPSGKIIWEINPLITYGENGSPAKFMIYYYDTNKVDAYPYYPDSITQFNNYSFRKFQPIKHGVEYLFYSLNDDHSSIKEKKKWRKGELIRTRKYPPGKKELRYFRLGNDWTNG